MTGQTHLAEKEHSKNSYFMTPKYSLKTIAGKI